MNKYAIFIGIDQYDDTDISPLRFAAQDARELAGWFQFRLGFETEILTHEELKKGRRVIAALRDVEKKVRAGDVFVLYFAGHGKTVRGEDQLLLFPEAASRPLRQGVTTGEGIISCQYLRTETENWPDVARVFIFDACREPLLVPAMRGNDEDDLFQGEAAYRSLAFGGSARKGAAPAAPVAPLAIFNSCEDQARAAELPQLRHGLFSAALLKTLNECDLAQALVLDQSLQARVATTMQTLARQHGRAGQAQQPLLLGPAIALHRPAGPANDPRVVRWRADFERQLNAGQYDKPAHDNCLETLRAMEAAGARDPALNLRLQAVLDAREHERARELDQRQYDVAQAVGTLEAFVKYVEQCQACLFKEQALQAIRALRAPAPIPVPIPARPPEPGPASSSAPAPKPVSAPTATRVEPPRVEVPSGMPASAANADQTILKRNARNQRAYVTVIAPVSDTFQAKLPTWFVLLVLSISLGLVVLLAYGMFGGSGQVTPASSPLAQASTPASAAEDTGAPGPSATVALAEPAASANSPKPKPWKAGDELPAECTGCPQMVYIPAGEFKMGDDTSDEKDEKPAHDVKLQAFFMGKTEVTVGQYLACVQDKACNEPAWREAGSDYHHETGTEKRYSRLGSALTGENHPIIGVSWDNAKQYVAWLSKKTGQDYRLPSEAQWEYAARAGSVGKWSFGDDESRLKQYAWYGEDWKKGNTHPAGQKTANQYGLHDMHGNVWEWVEDCWHDNYKNNPPVDGSAWVQNCSNVTKRVTRGGSWFSIAVFTRSANRDRITQDYRSNDHGVRVARTLP